jgi:DNA-binding GntR family transcriptional regulator
MKIPKSSQNPKPITVQRIADSLRADILQGRFKSRQPLRQDEIAATFGVSKIPVREALVQLKAEGLVTFFQNRGAFVSEISAAEAKEIFTMRIALETKILQFAIPKLTIADLARAEEIIETTSPKQNMALRIEKNWELHEILYAPANLPRMMEWINTLHNNVARYLVIYLSGIDLQLRGLQQHRKILDECRCGNIKAAVKHLEHHIQLSSDRLVEFLEQREFAHDESD